MGLRLPDRWIWDSWYAWDGDTCHVFYLCASRGLYDPIRRHRNTNIGHAFSTDLVNWQALPDALSPSESPAFDSWTTWTGSVVRDEDGKWWMFYTGTSRENQGRIQTIGAAVSDDLISWQKVDNQPLVSASDRWYENLGSQNGQMKRGVILGFTKTSMTRSGICSSPQEARLESSRNAA